jgi:hypothetical protein
VETAFTTEIFAGERKVTLFLVFAVVVRYISQQKVLKRIIKDRRSAAFSFADFAHVLAGIVYYVCVFIFPEYG